MARTTKTNGATWVGGGSNATSGIEWRAIKGTKGREREWRSIGGEWQSTPIPETPIRTEPYTGPANGQFYEQMNSGTKKELETLVNKLTHLFQVPSIVIIELMAGYLIRFVYKSESTCSVQLCINQRAAIKSKDGFYDCCKEHKKIFTERMKSGDTRGLSVRDPNW